jgi:hypothetical protein
MARLGYFRITEAQELVVEVVSCVRLLGVRAYDEVQRVRLRNFGGSQKPEARKRRNSSV